jgi:GH15 family glucan-1,4-alpha-glucosidase
MAERLEDYAFVSDSQSAALISRQGSIDWLCFPRFDSAACLAALIGRPDNGHWSLAPTDAFRSRRYYSPGTLVLTTIHETDGGSVSVTDALIADERHHRLVRLVDGISGTVAMATKLVIRFDYGSIVPWVRTQGNGTFATGGPDALVLHTPVARRGEGLSTVAEFDVAAGERIPFELAWYQSTDAPPDPLDVAEAVGATIAWWRGWSANLKYDGAYKREVHESLTVLKGLTHQVTGAIVAAPTTSLPEWIGAGRN